MKTTFTSMKMLKSIAKLGFILLIGLGVNACSQSTSWREEVLLHDGSKLIVERSQSRGGRHEIGQEVPLSEHEISFTLPNTRQIIKWKSKRGTGPDSTNLQLLAVNVVQGVPYIVTHPISHKAHEKWGALNPPYVLFKYDGMSWQRIPLEELPSEIKESNVVSQTQAEEKRLKSYTKMVPSDEVQKINSEGMTSDVQYLRIFVRAPQERWKPRSEHLGPKAPTPTSTNQSTDNE